jgi:hypothetical protein
MGKFYEYSLFVFVCCLSSLWVVVAVCWRRLLLAVFFAHFPLSSSFFFFSHHFLCTPYFIQGLPKSPGLRAWFRHGSQAYYKTSSLKYEEPFIIAADVDSSEHSRDSKIIADVDSSENSRDSKKAEKPRKTSSLKHEEPCADSDVTRAGGERAAGGEGEGANTKVHKKVLCVHPHGIFCQGWGILFTRPELRSVTFCFASSLYASPFFGALSKIIGRPAPADKTSFQNLMRRGRSMALIPGGFQEATIHSRGAHRVTCGKGFIKYALQHGYALVPSYSFGENKTYNNFQGFWSPRLWLNKFGIPAVVPFGSWLMPVLPKSDGGLHIVVGKALNLPQTHQPTRRQVDVFHQKYMAALVSLFDRHKAACGEPDATLEVW